MFKRIVDFAAPFEGLLSSQNPFAPQMMALAPQFLPFAPPMKARVRQFLVFAPPMKARVRHFLPCALGVREFVHGARGFIRGASGFVCGARAHFTVGGALIAMGKGGFMNPPGLGEAFVLNSLQIDNC